MNYSEIFHFMRPELTLIVTIALLFLFDLFAPERLRRYFHPLACVLLTVQILVNIVPTPDSGQLFGGMYQYEPMQSIVKSMLAIGTFVVFLQSNEWLRREDTAHKRGEFYLLTLSTLLGMYFMISAGNFLMFFLGMELASIPMACLIAFDKYRHNSAEAGAKYILCALFSSGLMLYGISFIYGTAGTLYFDDIRLDGSPLQIMALVFFFSGLGFKLSLVPFHLWTADAYQGAPTTVTSYLSVISKGSAAFVLMTILIKVFAPMVQEWRTILFVVIILSITVANLFAIRQQNLKRFLAFSSISQAGYIMLGVIGGSALGMTSLVYYILVYMAANLSIFGIVSAVEQHTDGKVSHRGLQRFLPHQPQTGRADDPLALLAGRHPALRRLFLEVLHLRGRFQGGISSAGFHRPAQHSDLALLLPAGGQSHVHHPRRTPHPDLPQRSGNPFEPGALYCRCAVVGYRQCSVRFDRSVRLRHVSDASAAYYPADGSFGLSAFLEPGAGLQKRRNLRIFGHI